MSTVDPERLARIESTTLLCSSHSEPDSPEEIEACVMEAVAYVAGEAWSDEPACACPVIGAFMRSWNDGIGDNTTRTRLLRPLVPRLVGSRSTAEVELKRSYLALDWLARVCAPAWLELAGLRDHADLCRQLGELCDAAACETAQPILSAAWSAALSAAWSAALSAAESAALSAAWSAALSAAESAALSAARSAAESAALSAARSAAESAAESALAPTVEQLQASALDLVDRILALGEPS